MTPAADRVQQRLAEMRARCEAATEFVPGALATVGLIAAARTDLPAALDLIEALLAEREITRKDYYHSVGATHAADRALVKFGEATNA